MNISDSRKVVLASLREVPYEITFQLSDSTQDPVIKNRYWFEFPNQWANQPNKDAIIGVRSIYLTKTNRYIRYSYKIELIPVGETQAVDKIEGSIDHWMEDDDTVRAISHTWADANRGWRSGNRPDEYSTYSDHEWQAREIVCYYGYDRQTNITNLWFGRNIGSDETVFVKANGLDIECEYKITITPESDDAKALFGFTNERTAITRLSIPLWSRYNCLVKSSLADDDKNNILGYTRGQAYTPIKYYRMHSRDKRFWIELYESRFPDCPVSLPKKIYIENNDIESNKIDRDDMFIEAIVCFTTDAMI